MTKSEYESIGKNILKITSGIEGFDKLSHYIPDDKKKEVDKYISILSNSIAKLSLVFLEIAVENDWDKL